MLHPLILLIIGVNLIGRNEGTSSLCTCPHGEIELIGLACFAHEQLTSWSGDNFLHCCAYGCSEAGCTCRECLPNYRVDPQKHPHLDEPSRSYQGCIPAGCPEGFFEKLEEMEARLLVNPAQKNVKRVQIRRAAQNARKMDLLKKI